MAVAVKRCVLVAITDQSVTCKVACAGGEIVFFSHEDAAFISTKHWSVSSNGYVKRAASTFGETGIFMHRDIATRSGHDLSGRQIDHKNGEKLDNRRVNLRPCTATQNRRNMTAHKNNKLGVRGVRLTSDGAYTATIRYEGRNVHLGRFKTLDAAKAAREAKEREVYGEFSVLNRGGSDHG